ncbi:MAG: site-specific DNA-methyltransferase [Dehalococcoidales bacterium]|nr:site-specific DNA-methyltransferase [Dehalococcoidales bacterium]
MKTNTLFKGDNLTILREHFPDGSIDLVYLDPPFGSNRNHSDTNSHIAFSDTWKWDSSADAEIIKLKESSPALAALLEGITGSTGQDTLATYLVMMAPRLLEIHRIMKDTGSLYLHCDPTSSHYLKVVLDCLFGTGNFRNEIAWAYKGGGRSKKTFARKHDVILFYSKSSTWTFNYRDIMVDRTNRTWFTDEEGKKYWLKYGKRYYLKYEGKVPEDWWPDIDPLHGPYNERLGYPTQKPLALLDRIIKAGSNPGDTVLDPFCGCGTTLVAAEQLGRKWSGIDISSEAVELTQKRLNSTFQDIDYTILK